MDDARPDMLEDERVGSAEGPSYEPPAPPPPGLDGPDRSRNPLVIALLAAVLGGLIGGGIVAAFGPDHKGTSTTVSFGSNSSRIAKPQDIQGILAKVEPGVVSVRTQGFEQGAFFPRERRRHRHDPHARRRGAHQRPRGARAPPASR